MRYMYTDRSNFKPLIETESTYYKFACNLSFCNHKFKTGLPKLLNFINYHIHRSFEIIEKNVTTLNNKPLHS